VSVAGRGLGETGTGNPTGRPGSGERGERGTEGNRGWRGEASRAPDGQSPAHTALTPVRALYAAAKERFASPRPTAPTILWRTQRTHRTRTPLDSRCD